MNKLTFDDYAYDARNTAFFLGAESEKEQLKIVHQGFNEEVGELLTDERYPLELTSKLWGIEVDQSVSEQLDADKISEAGDVLYYITAAGALRNIALRDIAREAVEHYSGTNAWTWDESIGGLDRVLVDQMGGRVPETYRPDYLTWKMWDFAPFEDGLHIVLREPSYAKGPLRLISDGRYALERLHSTFGRFMHPESSTDDEFVSSAALALGSLSIVLQNRFNGSLLEAAENNMLKRKRRQELDTLRDGIDAERSRTVGQERPVMDDEESTKNNLLDAPIPEF